MYIMPFISAETGRRKLSVRSDWRPGRANYAGMSIATVNQPAMFNHQHPVVKVGKYDITVYSYVTAHLAAGTLASHDFEIFYNNNLICCYIDWSNSFSNSLSRELKNLGLEKNNSNITRVISTYWKSHNILDFLISYEKQIEDWTDKHINGWFTCRVAKGIVPNCPQSDKDYKDQYRLGCSSCDKWKGKAMGIITGS